MRFFNRERSEVLVHSIDGTAITGADVAAKADYFRAMNATLAFILTDATRESVLGLLGALEAGIPLLPFDARANPESINALVDRYQPDLMLTPESLTADLVDLPPGEILEPGCWRLRNATPTIHPDLCLLLPTSGSTGSPKLVRLSRRNLLSNATAIAASVDINAASKGITSLPLFYSFGLSVLTSHICAGSSVLVTNRSVIEKEFWQDINSFRVTHLAGVPQTFLMLRRMGFDELQLPHLEALQQAGGRLDDSLVRHFTELCVRTGRRFYVMYGQTEASPRMSCLPPARAMEKQGSVGVPLEGGQFTIESEAGDECSAGQTGEVIYRGPNVMMGYATEAADLSRGDDNGGALRTGDLGYLDGEGFLFLTGRLKRIAKLAGVRVALDEVERMISTSEPVAAVATEADGLVIFTTSSDTSEIGRVRRELATALRTAPKLLQFRQLSELPTLPSGKTDYAKKFF